MTCLRATLAALQIAHGVYDSIPPHVPTDKERENAVKLIEQNRLGAYMKVNTKKFLLWTLQMFYGPIYHGPWLFVFYRTYKSLTTFLFNFYILFILYIILNLYIYFIYLCCIFENFKNLTLENIKNEFTTLEWIGIAFFCIGTYIRELSKIQLGRHFTYALSIRDNHKLIQHGLYSYIRHPGYFGLFQ